MMATAEALLADIHEHPKDDTPRLVYADWLMEHGDATAAARGEFIRVQVELARLPKGAPRRRGLMKRQRELLRVHDAAWRAELPTLPGVIWGPFERGFPASMRVTDWAAVFKNPDLDRQALDLARNHPHAIRPLTCAAMLAQPDSYNWHRATLSFLPEHDWPGVVEDALEALKRNPRHHMAEEVIEQACRQCPLALHPHLDAIFTRGILARTIYKTWPWRESGRRHLPFLRRIVDHGKADPQERLRAWWNLLQTRDPEVLSYALSKADVIQMRVARNAPFGKWRESYLAEVGLASTPSGWRSLFTDRAWHIVFPEGYLEEKDWRRKDHPTWHVSPTDTDARPMPFGGSGQGKCVFCGGKLHHMLTLDPVPEGVGVTGLRRLSLEVCLSCLGWEEVNLFYAHDGNDGNGTPAPIEDQGRRTRPRFPVGPLRPAAVTLAETERRWLWPAATCGGSEENIHRVGGPPSWVQGADYLSCPRCRKAMSFLLQLDSGLPAEDARREWAWGSGGVGYCLWCDGCRVSAWLWQCT
jgi:uncharacterized protein (TIGR02996 family)